MSEERAQTAARTLTAEGRGQLVLVAAGLVAVALVPVALAYLQLGYHADVEAGGDLAVSDPTENAERLLERGVHEAAVSDADTTAEAVERTRADLAPWLDRLRSARVVDGVAYRVSYNGSAATAWAATECPDGPGRSFGPCRAREGVVTQERAGDVHTVAVALDVTVVTREGETRLTFVVRAVGGT